MIAYGVLGREKTNFATVPPIELFQIDKFCGTRQEMARAMVVQNVKYNANAKVSAQL